ncbi:MAG: hypothetical protein WC705_00170 [Candidatus Paceibacterota bacterium]|jgi:hypothetical protein
MSGYPEEAYASSHLRKGDKVTRRFSPGEVLVVTEVKEDDDEQEFVRVNEGFNGWVHAGYFVRIP